jgi:hypothetical protein
MSPKGKTMGQLTVRLALASCLALGLPRAVLGEDPQPVAKGTTFRYSWDNNVQVIDGEKVPLHEVGKPDVMEMSLTPDGKLTITGRDEGHVLTRFNANAPYAAQVAQEIAKTIPRDPPPADGLPLLGSHPNTLTISDERGTKQMNLSDIARDPKFAKLQAVLNEAVTLARKHIEQRSVSGEVHIREGSVFIVPENDIPIKVSADYPLRDLLEVQDGHKVKVIMNVSTGLNAATPNVTDPPSVVGLVGKVTEDELVDVRKGSSVFSTGALLLKKGTELLITGASRVPRSDQVCWEGQTPATPLDSVIPLYQGFPVTIDNRTIPAPLTKSQDEELQSALTVEGVVQSLGHHYRITLPEGDWDSPPAVTERPEENK